MILFTAAMLLMPVADKPFDADQWAECAQIALFRAESADGDAKDEWLGEAADYFDKAGTLLFPGKTLGDAEYEVLEEKGQARLAAQIGGRTAGAADYADVTLATCRLEMLGS